MYFIRKTLHLSAKNLAEKEIQNILGVLHNTYTNSNENFKTLLEDLQKAVDAVNERHPRSKDLELSITKYKDENRYLIRINDCLQFTVEYCVPLVSVSLKYL